MVKCSPSTLKPSISSRTVILDIILKLLNRTWDEPSCQRFGKGILARQPSCTQMYNVDLYIFRIRHRGPPVLGRALCQSRAACLRLRYSISSVRLSGHTVGLSLPVTIRYSDTPVYNACR